jgi:hypothetical protein
MRLNLQISLRNKTISVGSGPTIGLMTIVQSASPLILGWSDLFVSLFAPGQFNFKLFLTGTFSCAIELLMSAFLS